MKGAAAIVGFVLVAYIFAESSCGPAVQRELFVCRKGTPYVENNCNTCFCVDENDLVCTIQNCEKEEIKEMKSCSTGTTWNNGCNQCWCVNVGTVCTNFQCSI